MAILGKRTDTNYVGNRLSKTNCMWHHCYIFVHAPFSSDIGMLSLLMGLILLSELNS
jgi:hypothetical protein